MPDVAFVRTPVAPLQAEPRVSASQTSQALFGHGLTVLATEGAWRRVRTWNDGYEGWVHDGYLRVLDVPSLPDDPEVFGPWEVRTYGHVAEEGPPEHTVTPPPTNGVFALDCTIRAGERLLRLPLGAWAHADQEFVSGDAVPFDAMKARFPARGAALAESAWRFEGTRYEWGGVTPWGADCSGFVQAIYTLHGVHLPRDAWQQARVGRELALDLRADADAVLDAIAAADLLFFSDRGDGRVTHVGLALGERRMAHLALGRGGWAVEALDDVEDAYVVRLRTECVAIRRILPDPTPA